MITKTGSVFEAPLDQTLPPALQYDQRLVAFAAAAAEQFFKSAGLIRDTMGLYYRIDELDETMLDILASDLHVDWYDFDDDIEEKRATIASSVFVHRHMGTPAAIRRVIEDSFGEGDIEEWFDYGGEPHHFRVTTENVEKVNQNLEKFLDMIRKAKRASAVLESVGIQQRSTMTAGVGIASKTRFVQASRMEPTSIEVTDWLTDEAGEMLLDELGNGLVL